MQDDRATIAQRLCNTTKDCIEITVSVLWLRDVKFAHIADAAVFTSKHHLGHELVLITTVNK